MQATEQAMTTVAKGAFKVAGIALRTCNRHGQAAEEIPALWDRFFAEKMSEQLPERLNDDIIALYTDYEGDYTEPYTLILGYQVPTDFNESQLPQGMVCRQIADQTYRSYRAEGDHPQALINSWQEVWTNPPPRSYSSDFELYTSSFWTLPQGQKTVELFIALEESKRLTSEQMAKAQSRILRELQSREEALVAIRDTSKNNLMERWQQLLDVVLPVQFECASAYGFNSGQEGLSAFNDLHAQMMQEDKELKELNEKKWQYLLEKGFGITKRVTLSPSQAKNLIEDLAEAITSEEFLCQVDHQRKSLPQEIPPIERRKRLLSLLLPRLMQVMERHGFEGGEGYLLAQRALAEFHHDKEIGKRSQAAQRVLFQRAGLL